MIAAAACRRGGAREQKSASDQTPMAMASKTDAPVMHSAPKAPEHAAPIDAKGADSVRKCSDMAISWARTAVGEDRVFESWELPPSLPACIEVLIKRAVTPVLARARVQRKRPEFMFALRWIRPLPSAEAGAAPALALSYRASLPSDPEAGWFPLSMMVDEKGYVVVSEAWMISNPGTARPWTTEQWFCPPRAYAKSGAQFAHAFEESGEVEMSGAHVFDVRGKRVVFQALVPLCRGSFQKKPDVTREPAPFPEAE
jgi:hypothetical protein